MSVAVEELVEDELFEVGKNDFNLMALKEVKNA